MLSQTATDVLSECDYECVRAQLHQALRGVRSGESVVL